MLRAYVRRMVEGRGPVLLDRTDEPPRHEAEPVDDELVDDDRLVTTVAAR
jgi:hypothetical protein